MVVCRFFLQGNCRYGNKCFNEHPSGGSQGYSVTAQRQLFGGGGRGGNQGNQGNQNQRVSFRDSYGQNQNPYRWVAGQDSQQQQQGTPPAQTAAMSPADIVKGLAGEVSQNWEGGKIWPFTCLGFEKEYPSLPGFTDLSYEELRHEAYEARQQGSFDAYIQKVQSLYNDVDLRKQELKAPSMTLRQKLTAFIEDCRKKKQNSSGNQVSLFSDSGLFGSSGSTTQPSSGLFGDQTSTFGNQASTQSAFGQSGDQSLFGQSGTQSLFGQPSQTAPPAFGQTAQPTSGFGQTSQPTGGFGQAAFGQAAPAYGTPVASQSGGFGHQPSDATTTPRMSLFGKPSELGTPQGVDASHISTPTQNPFGQSPVVPSGSSGSTFGAVPPAQPQQVASSTTKVSSIYTPLAELTTQEIEQFNANTFTVGLIPTRPPARELCF